MQLIIAGFAGILLPYIHMHTTLLCFSPLPECVLPLPSLLPIAPSPPLPSPLSSSSLSVITVGDGVVACHPSECIRRG